ncbi:MAG TPA: PIG-L deacetylase family protein [Burkholderiales bacterium]
MEQWFVPYRTDALPRARRVTVLAPHPDDEVFGCGGALLEYLERGARVEVVVLTDGAAQAVGVERERIAGVRRRETDAALALLGAPPAVFWNLPDRSLAPGTGALARRIGDHLAAARMEGAAVDVLLAPSLVEVHPDHAATARACVAALAALSHGVAGRAGAASPVPCPQLLMYEVGAALAPNLLLDISRHWPKKKSAMACFVSQHALQDYGRHIEGLNVFRTYTLGAVAHAEAYRRVRPEELAALAGAAPTAARAQYWGDEALLAAEAQCEAMGREIGELRGEIARLQGAAGPARRLLRPLVRLLRRLGGRA